MCFSMKQWVDQLKTCQDEESFRTTYQSFLNTTWQAIQGHQQTTNTFPYVQPTQQEVKKAYYMRNRTLILHNQIVWGEGADDDRPAIPKQQERTTRRSSTEDTGRRLPTEYSEKRTRSGDDDGDDPNKRRPDADPPGKGDESQDPTKKKDEKEATSKDSEKPEETSTDKAAQDRIKDLERQLKQAREDAQRAAEAARDAARAARDAARAARDAARAAQQAAEEKARQLGEELAQQVDDEKARRDRKREASKEKKRKKKSKKGATQAPPSGDEGDSSSSEEKDDDKPEGDSKKPEGDKESDDKKPEEDKEAKDKPEGDSKKPEGDKESKDKPEGESKKPEGDEGSEEKAKPDGEEETKKTEEGPPKDEEPKEAWTEVLRKATKPRQNTSEAADRARDRIYPRPRFAETAKPDYTYKPQHVPTREPIIINKWSVSEKTKDIPINRRAIRLKAICAHGTRRRYTDYKICVLQVLSASKQTPPPATPFALDGGETYWVQTTMKLHDDGSLPFSELPGMFPRLYSFDKFWEIPRRQEGQQLMGVTLGVAQYIVGTFELEIKKRAASTKVYEEMSPIG